MVRGQDLANGQHSPSRCCRQFTWSLGTSRPGTFTLLRRRTRLAADGIFLRLNVDILAACVIECYQSDSTELDRTCWTRLACKAHIEQSAGKLGQARKVVSEHLKQSSPNLGRSALAQTNRSRQPTWHLLLGGLCVARY